MLLPALDICEAGRSENGVEEMNDVGTDDSGDV